MINKDICCLLESILGNIHEDKKILEVIIELNIIEHFQESIIRYY